MKMTNMLLAYLKQDWKYDWISIGLLTLGPVFQYILSQTCLFQQETFGGV